MFRCIIQSGHVNIKYNSIVDLRNKTGAPGEQDFTLRIANRLSEILRSKGFEIKQSDANSNDDKSITEKDWDLFLSIHYDADSPNGQGGCVGSADPSLDDATVESTRIRDAMRSEYFKHTGIVGNNAKIGVNITRYYMWQYLTAKTPCVLIECGEGKDPHDSVILADTDRVCNAIARGICKAFGINFDTQPAPQPSEPMATITRKYLDVLRLERDKNYSLWQAARDLNIQLQLKIDKAKEILK